MLEQLKIGTRLQIALGLMSLLVATVAFSGGLGLHHVRETMQEILLRDAHLEQVALEARVSALLLRRYEKDYLLNIGAPDVQADYLTKWRAAQEDLVGHLDELERIVSSSADRDTLGEMQDQLAIYVGGFEKVTAAIRSGDLVTPQAANLAITAYKDAIRRFEVTAGALGGAGDFRMRERMALLDADTRSTNIEMTVTALLAIGVAILLSVRLARSITIPILGVVSVARRIASGDLSGTVAVTARDETGELQKAIRAMADRLARDAMARDAMARGSGWPPR
jgi:methyl-accepting chemotaxis protein